MTSSISALEVLLELLGVEGDLAHARVHDARLLGAELDLAALGVATARAQIEGDGADLRVRHQAAGSEHLTETADD
jgi:hypothetical protein